MSISFNTPEVSPAIWEYKRTTQRFCGSVVYRAFFFGEDAGLRIKVDAKVLRQVGHGKKEWKLVKVGKRYSRITQEMIDAANAPA